MTPCDNILNAISSFLTPPKYHRCKILVWASQPSCVGILIKPHNAVISGPRQENPNFVWNESLEKAFQQSKQIIVSLVKKGVTTFNINRVTCWAPDWSKEGMGFLLLQKYCMFPTEKALVCRSNGWHIVYADSRFCTDVGHQ